LVILAGSTPPVAVAEIFKCVAKNGLPLYQNFPCQFDSLGLVGALVTKPVSQVKTAAPPDLQPIAATAIATRPHTGTTEPGAGMTSDEIWTLLGPPIEVISIHASEKGPGEIWRYADRRIRFNDDQVVLTVER
jgi:hypothetical protein